MSTATLERIINADPVLRQFFSSFRSPRYRYFHRGNRAYCWTVEPAKDEKGRMRYASWVANMATGKWVKSTRRDHAKRKDAKARALKLYQEASR